MLNLESFDIPSFKKGSGIHIKKKNRGKFTEYCGGKVTQKCIDKAKKSGNKTLVKRATFAENSRKWKYLQGGLIPKFLNPAGTLGWTMPLWDINSGWISDKAVSTPENELIYNPELDAKLNAESKQNKIRLHRDLLWKNIISLQKLHAKLMQKIDSAGIIPYIPEKAIKLTNAGKDTGVTFSTNLLDSIAKYSNITDLPLKSALGLVGQESTFGKGYGIEKLDVRPSILVSDWSYDYDYNIFNDFTDNPMMGLRKTAQKKSKGDENKYWELLELGFPYAKKQVLNYKYLPVLEHAFTLYKSGKYNPGDPRHTLMVEERGEALMGSPEILKWMNGSPYVTTEKQGGQLIPKHFKGNTIKLEPQKEPKLELSKQKAPTVNKDRPQLNRRYNYGRTTPAYPIPYRLSNPLLAYNPFMRNK